MGGLLLLYFVFYIFLLTFCEKYGEVIDALQLNMKIWAVSDDSAEDCNSNHIDTGPKSS
jgi:hypothetical protein